MRQIVKSKSKQLALAVVLVSTMAGISSGAEFFLRADTTIKTMPDGQPVVMWGFALDSAFGAEDGVVTVPGPLLTVPNDKKHLAINLDNNLGVPVSIVIPSQINTTMVPVKFTDDKGRQRIRSFTHETEPNNTVPVVYEWNNLRPGTYLYHSGSHPAVQVQMGLYGCLRHNVEEVNVEEVMGTATPNVAYRGVDYDTEVILCFSEIDPTLHQAVADGNYGPGKPVTSTMNYQPKYFLINGQPYSAGMLPVPAGSPNDRVLIRFVNAGLETHVPVLQGSYMSLVAEDGYPYNYAKEQYSLILPALKTKDAIIVPTATGTYPLYDRRLRLTNAGASPGGMLTFLEVTAICSCDFDGDGDVDFEDLAVLTSQWLDPNCTSERPCRSDLNDDGQVDFGDYSECAAQYRRSTCP